MIVHEELAALIKVELSQLGYIHGPEIFSVQGREGAVVFCQHIMRVRYVCAVMSIPSGFLAKDVPRLLKDVRKELSTSFAQFPYWKGLGTFLVWICEKEEYTRLEGETSRLYDRTGFHFANTLLGAILVCPQQGTIQAECTWGLLISGEHFDAMTSVVGAWARRKARVSG